LNQYITQRTLGSKSLAQGQKGVVFAAALKLVIPFLIVFPGIAAFNLFSDSMAEKAGEDNIQILEGYEAIVAAGSNPENMIFEFDEHWRTMNPEKASEIDAFNERAEQAAEAEGGTVTPAKRLVGYKYDTAFGLLIGKLVPSGVGLQGFILAAILGAVVSSLASMLNSASTIFTMDLYRKYLNRSASQKRLVLVGRISVGIFVVIGCSISPILDDPRFGGVFTYIQEFQGFISPGILGVFVYGFLVRRAPAVCGIIGLWSSPVIYLTLKLLLPNLAFLDRMAVVFFCVLSIMAVLTILRPRPEPLVLPVQTKLDLQPSPAALAFGMVVVGVTLTLYAFFW
jgi:SSS family solute:Na+ symporter